MLERVAVRWRVEYARQGYAQLRIATAQPLGELQLDLLKRGFLECSVRVDPNALAVPISRSLGRPHRSTARRRRPDGLKTEQTERIRMGPRPTAAA